MFDCGGLGIGSGGHGHADALSLQLFSGGQQFLIDPGTSVYNCAPEWRNFFRSTARAQHSSRRRQRQSEPGGTFRLEDQKSECAAAQTHLSFGLGY